MQISNKNYKLNNKVKSIVLFSFFFQISYYIIFYSEIVKHAELALSELI